MSVHRSNRRWLGAFTADLLLPAHGDDSQLVRRLYVSDAFDHRFPPFEGQ